VSVTTKLGRVRIATMTLEFVPLLLKPGLYLIVDHFLELFELRLCNVYLYLLKSKLFPEVSLKLLEKLFSLLADVAFEFWRLTVGLDGFGHKHLDFLLRIFLDNFFEEHHLVVEVLHLYPETAETFEGIVLVFHNQPM
jgi:hypothetical protein